MASTNKCPYCGATITSNDKVCPHCGAANALYVPDKSRVILTPHTIAELQEYCAERSMPLLRMRFFIGEDFKEPKAFGIYKDQTTGEFITYKNKANGERSIRYRGKNEGKAVSELYLKLLDECHRRNIWPDTPDGKPPKLPGGGKNKNKKKKPKKEDIIGLLIALAFTVVCVIAMAVGTEPVRKAAATLFLLMWSVFFVVFFLCCVIQPLENFVTRDRKGHEGSFTGIILKMLLITFCICLPVSTVVGVMAYLHPTGYYIADGSLYYRMGGSNYVYDDADNDWVVTSYDLNRDEYVGGDYEEADENSDWNLDWTDSFENTTEYEEYHSSNDSGDGGSDSWDSDYSDWDSGGTDWDSDW